MYLSEIKTQHLRTVRVTWLEFWGRQLVLNLVFLERFHIGFRFIYHRTPITNGGMP